MKLIIQIPCLNEEKTLPETLAELPRHIEGIDVIEWLIIDDGCTDRTVEVARRHGVDHVVSHLVNQGLAAAFKTGLNACLLLHADIIVNTDADNQYPGRYIADLVRPILDRKADIVIGDRQTNTIAHFSRAKKMLQRFGSATVRFVSQTDVPDATSGFRAFSRESVLQLNLLTTHTYTLETIIQAGKKGLIIKSLPFQTNPATRESRLIKSTTSYVIRSTLTILRLFILYEPFRTFAYLSLPFAGIGAVLWIRYLILLLEGGVGRGANIQSIVVGAVSVIIAFLVFLIGLVGELIAINRRLHEEALYYLKRSVLLDHSAHQTDLQRTREHYASQKPPESQ